jgi:hypothetical protein
MGFSTCDLDWTNFDKFYGRFEDIGLLYVTLVFHWLYEFGLVVLLGIESKTAKRVRWKPVEDWVTPLPEQKHLGLYIKRGKNNI